MIPNYLDQIKKSLRSFDYSCSELCPIDPNLNEKILPQTFNYLIHRLIYQNENPLYIIYYPQENLISVPTETDPMDGGVFEEYHRYFMGTSLSINLNTLRTKISLIILISRKHLQAPK